MQSTPVGRQSCLAREALDAARMHEGFSQFGAVVGQESHGVGEIVLAHDGLKIGE